MKHDDEVQLLDIVLLPSFLPLPFQSLLKQSSQRFLRLKKLK